MGSPPSNDVTVWIDFAYNVEQGLLLMVDLSKRVAFGGITLYQWIWYMAVLLLGGAVFVMFMANIRGLVGVSTYNALDGIISMLDDGGEGGDDIPKNGYTYDYKNDRYKHLESLDEVRRRYGGK